MDDLISRTAAIEALSTPCDKRYRHGVWETCLDNIETAIRNIPAVDAAPVVHGRWIRQSGSAFVFKCSVFKCSACEFKFAGVAIAKHCPNCGAKMDGE